MSGHGDQDAREKRWRSGRAGIRSRTCAAHRTRMLTQALGQGSQQQGVAANSTPAWAPALDISERKDAYLVTVELPGVELDDLQITLEGGLLTIQGERHFAHDSSEQQFHRVE